MDVDHETDYKEMVNKIREYDVGTTKIFVDMKSVKKLPTTSGSEPDEDGETTDADAAVCTYLLPAGQSLKRDHRARQTNLRTWRVVLCVGVSSFRPITRMTLMPDIRTLVQWEQLCSHQP
jgi:hypothetical protein